MKVMEIPIEVDVFGTIPKGPEKRLGERDIRGLLILARVLGRVCRDLRRLAKIQTMKKKRQKKKRQKPTNKQTNKQKTKKKKTLVKTDVKITILSNQFIVKALDFGIVVREFELQSRYYIHFQTNTLGKGMSHRLNSTTAVLLKERIYLALHNPRTLICL